MHHAERGTSDFPSKAYYQARKADEGILREADGGLQFSGVLVRRAEDPGRADTGRRKLLVFNALYLERYCSHNWKYFGWCCLLSALLCTLPLAQQPHESGSPSKLCAPLQLDMEDNEFIDVLQHQVRDSRLDTPPPPRFWLV